jgi:hypothetical protein
MRQDQDVTRENLLAILKTLHTSDILGGIWAIRDYALNTFHGGKDPKGENENPIFKEAAEQFAYYEHSASEFDNMLADYTKLLEMFSAYLSTEGMIAEQAEITRIQSALAVQSARPEPAHAPSIPSTMRQDSSKPDINTSLITLRDSLKTVHPADIKSGVKALTRFMSEQMVIVQALPLGLIALSRLMAANMRQQSTCRNSRLLLVPSWNIARMENGQRLLQSQPKT